MTTPTLPENLVPTITYIVQATENVFAYKFYVVDSADFYLYLNGVEVSSNNYALTGVEDRNGGTATVNTSLTPLSPGDAVTLSRFTVPEQLTEFLRTGDFTANTVNSEYNRIYALLQERDEGLSRAIKTEQGQEAPTYNELIQDIEQRDDQVLNESKQYTDNQVFESGAITPDTVNKGDEQVSAISIYPKEITASANTTENNQVPSGTSAIRDGINKKIYKTKNANGMDIQVQGEITAIDFALRVATIGGDSVLLSEFRAASDSSFSFDTIGSLDASILSNGSSYKVAVGDLVSVENYAQNVPSGRLYGKIVSGQTPDGGKIIDLPTLGLQFEQNFSLPYSLSAWGVVGDEVTDFSARTQVAIDYVTERASPLRWVDGNVLITESLTLYPNTRIFKEVEGGLLTSFGMAPATGGILFSPTSANDDLFEFTNFPGETDFGFYTNISVTGLWLKAGNTNARYAFYLDHVIESAFMFGEEGFVAGSYHDGTINNNFYRCTYSDNTSACVFARNISTTDVFDTCRFQQSPTAIDNISCVSMRFVNCLFEQIDNYVLSQNNTARATQFDTCYTEDCPYNNTVADSAAAIFNIAQGQSPAQTAISLIVTGGVYSGNNTTTKGSLLNADYLNGAVFSNLEANRFTQLFKTTANTSDRAIFVSGIGGVSWGVATDLNKVQGMIPSQAQAAGSGMPHNAYLNVVYSNFIRARAGNKVTIDAAEVQIGELHTNNFIGNTNAIPSNSVAELPVYNAGGTQIGSIPIFTAGW